MIFLEFKPPEPLDGQILLSGDEQSGTDAVLLSGDEQSGSDVVKYYEVL
jgi:hypothetical protein